jgi:hypothetical protein
MQRKINYNHAVGCQNVIGFDPADVFLMQANNTCKTKRKKK